MNFSTLNVAICASPLSFLCQIVKLFLQRWPCRVEASAVAVYYMPMQTIATHPEAIRALYTGKLRAL
jgi:hypothetical protein